jgi:hypothetical protein
MLFTARLLAVGERTTARICTLSRRTSWHEWAPPLGLNRIREPALCLRKRQLFNSLFGGFEECKLAKSSTTLRRTKKVRTCSDVLLLNSLKK